MTAPRRSALSGRRIPGLCRLLPGPYATSMPAGLGADARPAPAAPGRTAGASPPGSLRLVSVRARRGRRGRALPAAVMAGRRHDDRTHRDGPGCHPADVPHRPARQRHTPRRPPRCAQPPGPPGGPRQSSRQRHRDRHREQLERPQHGARPLAAPDAGAVQQRVGALGRPPGTAGVPGR
ncbi:hypothetical protein GCM10010377_51400 [Streptomyces viridiviolaceus]|uniref:Uncharacterized protein n=1 Tax=Streptomyces viridiviolaceus TaxID=68282 RepID=A0ABW2E7F2_9ACTN|nr:hypothetical protein [Streptomyces viridiviolaceus]GHB54114.1 hypothetical protein GCM10010377_51400 [Streptomyces viridiviolaceus]